MDPFPTSGNTLMKKLSFSLSLICKTAFLRLSYGSLSHFWKYVDEKDCLSHLQNSFLAFVSRMIFLEISKCRAETLD